MKRILPSMEGVERDMVIKLDGLENRLVTSQAREAIDRAVANSVTEMVDGRYSRLCKGLREQSSEHKLLMEGSIRLFYGGEWRWRM